MHPFDDPVVIAGQGTIGLEILEDAPDIDAVVVPLGGGGLLSGIASAIKAVRPEIRVIGVEAAGCAPYVSSLKNGAITPVPQTQTIADGIAVKRPGEITFGLIRDLVDDVVTVTDAEIGRVIVHLLEREKTVVEGAGAVALAALVNGKVSAKRAVAVLSGGNIDTPLLMQVIRFGLTVAGRYLVIRTRLTDRPGELMHLLQVVAQNHVNILLISHHRESVDVAVAETGIELTLETRDEAHAASIVELVRDAGYPVTRMHWNNWCRHRYSVADVADFRGEGAAEGGAGGRFGHADRQPDQGGVETIERVSNDHHHRRGQGQHQPARGRQRLRFDLLHLRDHLAEASHRGRGRAAVAHRRGRPAAAAASGSGSSRRRRPR